MTAETVSARNARRPCVRDRDRCSVHDAVYPAMAKICWGEERPALSEGGKRILAALKGAPVDPDGMSHVVVQIPQLLTTLAAVRFLSMEPLLGPVEFSDVTRRADVVAQLGRPALSGIGWVIVGGESGPGHRQMDPAWARSLRDQCVAAGVPFLFKQWGGRTSKAGGRELDGRTWDEYPAVAS